MIDRHSSKLLRSHKLSRRRCIGSTERDSDISRTSTGVDLGATWTRVAVGIVGSADGAGAAGTRGDGADAVAVERVAKLVLELD